MQWHDVAGSTGAAIILVSYLLLQLQRMTSSGLAYSALNALGAFLILVSLLVDFNLAAFIVEAFWMVISLYGIARWRMRRSMALADSDAIR
jgi:hypothetical protein